ncbi:sugar nucleotide-binding protein [Lysinibacillus pakistanensis]|uniref:dTDP-4-dehydrorhamnose reductase n=1 Tax=Lysinibacillus pakistanensis TaxID=759811 RepID=A0ABX6D662_9BACI|nr:sugar nucleotide-binding protein [Lysinibacillus pakistanensis]
MGKTKVLVLGANGMAGHVISLYLEDQSFEVHTITRRPYDIGKNHVIDVNDFDKLEVYIRTNSFNAIVNCIGILNEEAENKKYEAVKLNSLLSHFLVTITQDSDTRVIHLSTDCVFSGMKGNYCEDEFKDGRSFYDKSKALGEIVDDKNLTFRNSIIGPDLTNSGTGLFNWFMNQKGEISGYTHAIWNGVTTITLAKAIEQAIKENLIGLYQLVSKPINKYELLLLFNQVFKQGSLKIIEDSRIKVDKTLVNSRNDFSFIVPSQEEMIFEMKDWIEKHKELYLHYFSEELELNG